MKHTGPAVIWDMDGVLVDTLPLHYQALRIVLEKYSISFPENTDGEKPFGFLELINKSLGSGATDAVLFAIMQEQESLFRSNISRGILSPRPGVVPLLKSLGRHGFRQALVSSAPMADVSLILARLGLSSYFNEMVCSEHITRAKPNPQVFIVAAARLKVDILECLVIETSPKSIEAAKKIGMRCIGLTTNYALGQPTSADKIVDSVEKVSASDIMRIFNYEDTK